MSTKAWDDYKKTMAFEPEVFEFARTGDRRALLDALPLFGDLERKNARGYSLLMLAAYHGHADAAEALLDLGADPDTADRAGNTALMGAAFKGDAVMLRLLCAHGADAARTSQSGLTALDVALMFGRREAAAELARRTGAAHRPGLGFVKAWIGALRRALHI
jgi:ankyrin repeat protein